MSNKDAVGELKLAEQTPKREKKTVFLEKGLISQIKAFFTIETNINRLFCSNRPFFLFIFLFFLNLFLGLVCQQHQQRLQRTREVCSLTLAAFLAAGLGVGRPLR